MKRLLFIGLPVLLLILLLASRVLVARTDAGMNAVAPHAPYSISTQAQSLHDRLTIVDLHADTLLWARNPAKRHARGQTDLPRLRGGGTDVQVFGAVTASPRGQNFDANSIESGDNITFLAIAQRWPRATWTSWRARALYQADRLAKLERDGELTVIRTVADLDAPGFRGLMAAEGSHSLEGDLTNIPVLFAAGFRMMGLQHFFDNDLGGSMHGLSQSGLTPFGHEAVAAMVEAGMIIDVAHSSTQTVRDVLALTDAPVLISHGGTVAGCPRTTNRNLSDDVMVEIARRGGIVGIGYFSGVICDTSPGGIADAIIAAVNLLGEDAVALGSDFDGAVTTTLDAAELPAITQALLDREVSETVIAKVMGQNALTFLRENLPRK